MAKKDILEGFLSDLEMEHKKERPKLKDYSAAFEDQVIGGDEILKDIQKKDINSLIESQREIAELIEERKKLTKELMNDIDKIVSQINTMTISVSTMDPNASSERLNLLKKKAELEEMKVKEKLECWRDIALLKKELREWSKELREKQSEANMLDKILD
ncbi:MAG: hypothetical protein PHT54_01705 [Candidatus Nanoarchaeia archaeon]|nr:hypothetical protein [Candidatus Nanoarchaeia archaeon]